MSKIAVNQSSVEQKVAAMKRASNNFQSRSLTPIDEISTITAARNGRSLRKWFSCTSWWIHI